MGALCHLPDHNDDDDDDGDGGGGGDGDYDGYDDIDQMQAGDP